MTLTPLETLQAELGKYEDALRKSKRMLKEGKIDESLHNKHKTNLNELIKDFRYAIRVLTTYM